MYFYVTHHKSVKCPENRQEEEEEEEVLDDR
jgi:hypothetical protein